MLKIIKTMEMIHKSETGNDEIYVIKFRSGTRKRRLMFIVLEENGEYSAPIFKDYDKVQVEDLGFLKCYGQSITEKDVQIMSKYLIEKWDNIAELKSKDKLSIRETYTQIYKYYLKNKEISNTNAFVKDSYFNIATAEFNAIIETCGYSSLYLKKILKENEMLRTNSTRPYDYSIKIKNENHWYISIDINDLEKEAQYILESDVAEKIV
jgi:hypothetical protein